LWSADHSLRNAALGHPVAAYVFFLVFPSLVYPSLYFSFNNAFYKSVPTQDVTSPVSLLLVVCRIFLFSPLSLILLHFSHALFNRSSPSISKTTLQNFPVTSYLPFDVSNFQHHTQLCSKCRTLLVEISSVTKTKYTSQYVFHKIFMY